MCLIKMYNSLQLLKCVAPFRRMLTCVLKRAQYAPQYGLDGNSKHVPVRKLRPTLEILFLLGYVWTWILLVRPGARQDRVLALRITMINLPLKNRWKGLFNALVSFLALSLSHSHINLFSLIYKCDQWCSFFLLL